MITVTTKIEGVDVSAFSNANDLRIKANFGDTITPELSIDNITFKNNERSLNSTTIRNLFLANPMEGKDVGISISDGTDTFNFNLFTDWTGINFLSDVSTSVNLKNKDGLKSLLDRLDGVTMELLRSENIFNPSVYVNVPYVVENRKTQLEKIQILSQGYSLLKTLYDEVHKVLNIASDLPTGGVLVAAINLSVTVANIVQLVNQFNTLVEQTLNAFSPQIRYHKGMSIKQSVEGFINYLGYSVDWGDYLDFENVVANTILVPSKDDEVGLTSALTIPENVNSGILKPNDFGYNGKQYMEAVRKIFYTRVEIIDGVVHVRPEKDPFWIRISSFAPNVLVEQIFANNGSYKPNYEEFYNNRIIQYSKDDSDLWTLTNINDQLSVTTVEPIAVTEQIRVTTGKGYRSEIPYALGVRKEDLADEILNLILGTQDELNNLKEQILSVYESYATALSSTTPFFASVISNIANIINRGGAMKVENNYFSVPKLVYLQDSQLGYRIPLNYTDVIGAIALENNYHNHLSFVDGVRNPSNLLDTNAKYAYESIEIPFNFSNFVTILTKPYFDYSGKLGKFTDISWNFNKDSATVSYWIQEAWMNNAKETTV